MESFLGAMKVLLCARREETNRAGIPKGAHGMLLPAEQRFACQQCPQNAIWVSGDATLHTSAGLSWLDKEYFVSDAPLLVRELKRDIEEKIIIGECELLVAIIGDFLGGVRNGHPELSYCARISTMCLRGWGSGELKLELQVDYYDRW